MKLSDAFLKLKMDDKVKREDGESYELRILLKIYAWSAKARKKLFKLDISDEELFANDWELANEV